MNVKTIVPVAITSLVFVGGIFCFVCGVHYGNAQAQRTITVAKSLQAPQSTATASK